MTSQQKKAIVKRSADAMEKLCIGSLLVGLFKGARAGIVVGLFCMAASYVLTYWEARL